ncbi:hypothetical protein XELAEV_18028523mg [Xenopus laevis]|uniref:CCHC-type domain-containing protein n=1 Tax=Xenopus laevis TaxID=8355 RepID=A0A974HH81_XENLA|nr:hypothetical protein XELAEV_18028523mg [Xenopus laevis]
MSSSAESPQSVLEWGKSLGLNPKKTAIVGPMIPRTKEEVIYKILDADGSIYRPRVVRLQRDPDGVWLNVLVDSLAEINRETCAQWLKGCLKNPLLSDVFEAAQLVEVLAQVGMEPTSLGEETFEVWRDSALTTVADWPGSGPALCRKIQKSLRGPALDLIKLHREVCQQDGPERIIATDCVDSMRLKQLFRGALSMDPTAVMLRSFYRGKKELTYQKLIREIRREEVNVLRREKKKRSSEKTSSDSLKEEFEKEIAELKARVEPPKCFLCGRLGHISTNCNKQREEVVAAEVTSSGWDVKKLPQKRYRKRRSQVKCYTCEVYEHSGTPNKHERLGLGKRKPSGRGHVRVVSKKVFPCDSPPEVRENKKVQEGQVRTLPIQAGGKCRGLVQNPCTYPCKQRSSTEPVSVCCKLLPSNQLLSATGSDTAASEWLAGKGSHRDWQTNLYRIQIWFGQEQGFGRIRILLKKAESWLNPESNPGFGASLLNGN